MALIKCPECGKEVSDKASACPNCGHPISSASPKTDESVPKGNGAPYVYSSPARDGKPPKKKSSLLKIILIVFGVLIVLAVIGSVVGGDEKKTTVVKSSSDNENPSSEEGKIKEPEENTDKEKEYITEDQIENIFTAPNELKGKYVKITGKVFTVPDVKDGTTALQVFYDTANSDKSYIVYVENASTTFSSGDYIVVDGKLDGTVKGTNLMGATIENPLIRADVIELSTYMDIVTPTKREVAFGTPIDQNGVVFTLDKIQFADKETRVYLTITNNSGNTFNFYGFNSKVVQNSQQYEVDSYSQSSYEGNYPEISSNILSGVSSSGVIVFPAFDSTIDYQLYFEGHSDDYNLNFNPYIFNCTGTPQ